MLLTKQNGGRQASLSQIHLGSDVLTMIIILLEEEEEVSSKKRPTEPVKAISVCCQVIFKFLVTIRPCVCIS